MNEKQVKWYFLCIAYLIYVMGLSAGMVITSSITSALWFIVMLLALLAAFVIVHAIIKNGYALQVYNTHNEIRKE